MCLKVEFSIGTVIEDGNYGGGFISGVDTGMVLECEWKSVVIESFKRELVILAIKLPDY